MVGRLKETYENTGSNLLNKKQSKDNQSEDIQVNVHDRGVYIDGDATGPIITGENNTILRQYFQIMPPWILTLIVSMMITGFGLIIWLIIPNRESEMVGDFRIAVAQMQWSGGTEPDSISKSLSKGIELNLERLIEELDLPFVITLWGPDKVGQIKGDSKIERAESAALIAERIKADIVVYGVINGEQSIWEVQPEFYISDRSETLSDAQEITGDHAIGTPFNTPGSDIAGRIALSENLRDRTELLSQIVLGVAFYSARNYPRALEFFESIENAAAWGNIGGEELLYLLIGNAAAKNKQIEKAEDAFLKAKEFNPDYSRAYAGLGSVRYLQAIAPILQDDGSEDFTKADTCLLKDSLDLLQNAQDSRIKPALADIDSKAHFGRGQALLMLTLSGEEIDPNDIAHEFFQVINEYGDPSNPKNRRVWDLAAESYGRLGLMFLLSNNLEQAKINYEKAVEILGSHPERQQIYQDRLNEINQALLDDPS